MEAPTLLGLSTCPHLTPSTPLTWILRDLRRAWWLPARATRSPVLRPCGVRGARGMLRAEATRSRCLLCTGGRGLCAVYAAGVDAGTARPPPSRPLRVSFAP